MLPAEFLCTLARPMTDAVYRAENGVAARNQSVDKLNRLLHPTIVVHHVGIGLSRDIPKLLHATLASTQVENCAWRQIDGASLGSRTARSRSIA